MCFHSKNNLKFRFFFSFVYHQKIKTIKFTIFFYNAVKSEKLYDGGGKKILEKFCVCFLKQCKSHAALQLQEELTPTSRLEFALVHEGGETEPRRSRANMAVEK